MGRKARREIQRMSAHARTARPVMPTTTPMVRVVGLASDAQNARKDGKR